MTRAIGMSQLKGVAAAIVGGFIFSLLAGGEARAANGCDPLAGRLASLDGTVQIQRGGTGPWAPASLTDQLCRDDVIRTGKNSRAALALSNDAIMRLDQDTTLKLLSVAPKPEERSVFSLLLGAVQSFSRKPRKFAVNTPYLNATIEGTEFVLRADAAQSEVTVMEGTVLAQNNQGRVSVTGGEAAAARQGQAPVKRIVVRPADAVQWALYYPPVLAAGQGEGAVRRAADLLNAGRVDQARTEIDSAIGAGGDAGAAYALRAIINVAQNRKDQALADAQEAVKRNPKSAAARIALSYALQAHFRLDAARDALRQAVADEPNNALAWARLSELWLMLGERGEARRAAQRATAIAPNSARAQTVLGFAALTEFRAVTASAAFDKAIAAAPSDPLPRLGLGLAKIRQGNLEAGRKDLEIAVSLDSQNALLRAYLGKAYFEEKRDPLDAQQFEIAKRLDPNDPTAYLYDAIRKQTENNPGGALTDLQESIARNDNRAVYRGRLQLDQDRAARGTSLARVYNDLGFTQAGVNEATKSLSLDPGNAAAHRFLSDSYRDFQGREISRVSELLQAQMLQDVNINPVQPSISTSNLNVVTSGGPASAGFNEFTPLFERNRVQLNASGFYGNNDTWGGETVASAVYDGFSASVGGYRYSSEGYRENNDLDHKIGNAFFQTAISPSVNVQFEFRKRKSEWGDLQSSFDPDMFNPNTRSRLQENLYRTGLRYSPDTQSTVLFSYVNSNRDTYARDLLATVPFVEATELGKQNTDQTEFQYIFKHSLFNVVSGISYAQIDTTASATVTVNGTPVFQISDDFLTQDVRGYLYTNVNFPAPVTWTLGASYTNFSEDIVVANGVTQVSPKFGVQWNVTKDIRIRGVYTKSVKPSLAANMTLEPTQVAGFNQFFDNFTSTKIRLYGAGMDWQVIPDLSVGIEATWRKAEEPFYFVAPVPPELVRDPFDEQLHRAYVYWKPLDNWAVRLAFEYDKFKRTSDSFSILTNTADPLETKTYSVPLGISYFHSSGLFATARATYVDQEVRRLTGATNQGSEQFSVVDVGVGYRFPNRIGIASVQVQNLFDSNFRYQDDSFRQFRSEPVVGRYTPDRTLMARVTLSF